MFLRTHCEARRLAKKVRLSLRDNSQEWCLAVGGLTHGAFRIVLIPRRLRLLDQVRIYKNDTEVWVPLFQRLRIRAVARYLIAKRANRCWDDDHTTELSD